MKVGYERKKKEIIQEVILSEALTKASENRIRSGKGEILNLLIFSVMSHEDDLDVGCM